jgi:hypothetical protein
MALSFIKLILLTLYILLIIFIILKVNASIINPTFGPGSPLYHNLQILRSKDIPNTSQYTGKNRNLKLKDATNIIEHVNNLQKQNKDYHRIFDEHIKIIHEMIEAGDKTNKHIYDYLLKNNGELNEQLSLLDTYIGTVNRFGENIITVFGNVQNNPDYTEKSSISALDKTIFLQAYRDIMKNQVNIQDIIEKSFNKVNENLHASKKSVDKQKPSLVIQHTAGPRTILYENIEKIRGPDITEISVETIGNSDNTTIIIEQIIDHVRNIQDQSSKDIAILEEQRKILQEYIDEDDLRKFFYTRLLNEYIDNNNNLLAKKLKSIKSYIETSDKIKKGSSRHDKTAILRSYERFLKSNAEFQDLIKHIFKVLNEQSYHYEIFLSKVIKKVQNVDIFLQDILDKIEQQDISSDKKLEAFQTIQSGKEYIAEYINNQNILAIASNDINVTLHAIDSVIESVKAKVLEYLQIM